LCRARTGRSTRKQRINQAPHRQPVAARNEDKTGVASSPTSDMLFGADAIAEFIWGSEGYRRSIYCLVRSNRMFMASLAQSMVNIGHKVFAKLL
jgi:hypothetical protein